MKALKDKSVPLTALFTIYVILIGANLRTAITAVPPILGSIQQSLHLPDWMLGSLTTIPLLCFAFISPLAVKLAGKMGNLGAITAALIVLTVGSAVRVYTAAALIVGTFLIGAAVAVMNVLLPAVITERAAFRVGTMTSVYTLSMTVFSALSAGLSYAAASAVGWRYMLQSLMLLPIAALLAGIALQRSVPVHLQARTRRASGETSRSVWKSRPAWLLTGFMGVQSLLFYTILTWLPTLFVAHGSNENTAGMLLGLMQLSSLPVAYLIPNLAARTRRQGKLIIVIGIIFFSGFAGLLIPGTSPLLWAAISVLLGCASNASFSLAMTLFSLKTATAAETAAFSGMAQSAGYLLAAVGPAAFGWLHTISQSWVPLIILFMLLAGVQTVFGLLADRKQKLFD